MRTLHVGIRVADPDRAVAFYTAVGYEVVGRVPDSSAGQLTMLKLHDDDVVSVELVFDARKAGTIQGAGLSHLVIQVESIIATVTDLRTKGVEVAEPVARRFGGLLDDLALGPRRQPDRAGPVARGPCRRPHRG